MTVQENEIGCLLSSYAALLLRSGATCARVEKNVGRMARRWGIEFEMTILPRHVSLVLRSESNDTKTFMTDIGGTCISFDKLTRLSRMSWEVADNDWDIQRAQAALKSISEVKPANKWWVLFAVSCANGAFCRLFSGDITAALVVALATMCGYYLKQLLLSKHMDVRPVFMICAFVSSVLACADSLFSLGETPEIAVGTSVLYLVPGIPFLNSFNDMLDKHYICFLSRLIDAVVLTCCLSVGICAGMWVMHIGMF